MHRDEILSPIFLHCVFPACRVQIFVAGKRRGTAPKRLAWDMITKVTTKPPPPKTWSQTCKAVPYPSKFRRCNVRVPIAASRVPKSSLGPSSQAHSTVRLVDRNPRNAWCKEECAAQDLIRCHYTPVALSRVQSSNDQTYTAASFPRSRTSIA